MTLRECYAALGGNFDDVMGRLQSERLVQKFILKFLDDGNYNLLIASLSSGNAAEAFRAAHTIKGMCQNLSFTRLEKSSTALTEALRGLDIKAADGLLEPLKEDYKITVEAIKAFKASIEG